MLHSAKLTNEKLFQAQWLETVSFVGGKTSFASENLDDNE